MDLDFDFGTLVVVLLVLLIASAVFRGWRQSRTPEARARRAEAEAAQQAAEAALGPEWKVTTPDRERYGAGATIVTAYGVSATREGEQIVIAVALSEAAAFDALVRAVRGELAPAEVWAPEVPDLTETASPAVDAEDVVLPTGWTALTVDRESYYTAGPSASTYGAMAVAQDGKRLLAVAQERQTAIEALRRLIAGEIEHADAWTFRVDRASPRP